MGKIVMITGCSSGIGRDLAGRLTAAGYTVAATARDISSLAGVDAALKLPLDVTDAGSVNAAVVKIEEELDPIDVLVNNAGFTTYGAVEELPEEQVEEMFEVNVLGVIRTTRAVIPAMRDRGSGRIINISSIAGRLPVPVNTVYSATKSAIEALSDGLRHELAPFGIQVVIIEPGAIATEFGTSGIARAGRFWTDVKSPYYRLYRKDETFTEGMRKNEAPPAAVSAVIQKAIEAPRPKARYKVNINALAKLLMILGNPAWNRVVKSIYKT